MELAQPDTSIPAHVAHPARGVTPAVEVMQTWFELHSLEEELRRNAREVELRSHEPSFLLVLDHDPVTRDTHRRSAAYGYKGEGLRPLATVLHPPHARGLRRGWR